MNFEDYKDIFEPFEKLVEIEILGENAKSARKQLAAPLFSISFDGNHFLRRFLLERRMCQLSGLAGKYGERKTRFIVPDKSAKGMKIVKMCSEIELED